MNYESKPTIASVPARSNVPELGFALCSVKDQIIAFLDGKTYGEELLHALYDYILDEPIPQRMRALFVK